MDEFAYKVLVRIATVMVLGWAGWNLYQLGGGNSSAVTQELAAAARYLEDGQYSEALASFEQAQRLEPENTGALRGKALALMQLGAQKELAAHQPTERAARRSQLLAQAHTYYQTALKNYNRAIATEEARPPSASVRSILGVDYANRGILKDRMGDHSGALADYKRAMKLEPEVSEGPGFLTRFLRNQTEKPPTVADRAAYLEQQLARPSGERLLRQIEVDARQRGYKM